VRIKLAAKGGVAGGEYDGGGRDGGAGWQLWRPWKLRRRRTACAGGETVGRCGRPLRRQRVGAWAGLEKLAAGAGPAGSYGGVCSRGSDILLGAGVGRLSAAVAHLVGGGLVSCRSAADVDAGVWSVCGRLTAAELADS